ncbi:hypothetical protein [Flavobacterium sp.]|uniref:hypothetical protein n=1 Tax=Flavobacterium sp. TaxID=239 RepID=UPI0031D2E39E
MSLTYKTLAISFIGLFLFSCSNDASTPQEKDDFSYLAVTSSGEISKIGNNSGKISAYAQFGGVQTTTINPGTTVSNSEKIFLIEHYTPEDKLFIFDKNSKTSTSKKLVYPKEIKGDEPTMSSLTWDDNQKILYGIVIGFPYLGTFANNSFLVKIDPATFEVTYLGLNFDQTVSLSTFINNTKLYSSSRTETFEIDLENYSAKKILVNNANFTFSHAAVYSPNTVYCLKNKVGEIGVTISKVNLTDNTSEDFLANESLGIMLQNGAGFIDKTTNEYVCYMLKNGYFELVKFNISTKTYKHFGLTSDKSVNNSIFIVDKINN